MTAPKLLEQVRQTARTRHLSLRTERAYAGMERPLRSLSRDPLSRGDGAPEIRAFLSHLAADRHGSASTQKQALVAVLFLDRQALEVVLTREEVRALLAELTPQPTHWLAASLLYGSGLRLLEALRLRTWVRSPLDT